MTKWRDEFCDTYKDTKLLRNKIQRVKKNNNLKKSMRDADLNITKITQGKLGRTL